MARKSDKWVDVAWVLMMGAQGGLMISLPVLIGLALGFWLDNQLDTLPWISLGFVLIGSIIGPIVIYRWVTSSVAQRVERRVKDRKKQDEETSE